MSNKALNENKKINIFRNIFVVSLILGLATMVYGHRLINKIEYIPVRLGSEVAIIEIDKNINKPETYKIKLKKY